MSNTPPEPKSVTDIRFDGSQIQVVSTAEARTVEELFNKGFSDNQRKITLPTLGSKLNIVLSKIIFYSVVELTEEIIATMQKKDPSIVSARMGIIGPDGKIIKPN